MRTQRCGDSGVNSSPDWPRGRRRRQGSLDADEPETSTTTIPCLSARPGVCGTGAETKFTDRRQLRKPGQAREGPARSCLAGLGSTSALWGPPEQTVPDVTAALLLYCVPPSASPNQITVRTWGSRSATKFFALPSSGGEKKKKKEEEKKPREPAASIWRPASTAAGPVRQRMPAQCCATALREQSCHIPSGARNLYSFLVSNAYFESASVLCFFRNSKMEKSHPTDVRDVFGTTRNPFPRRSRWYRWIRPP